MSLATNLLEITTALPVMEHFYTIQGEGAFTGQAAYFIRLGGCDVGCHWCDVKESWPIDTHPQIEINKIVNFVIAENSKIAVITGGEPLMHNCESLTSALNKVGIRTHIETSGAYKPTGNWNWFCLSPKKFKLPVVEAYQAANELKIIISNQFDFQFAEQQLAKLIQNSKFNSEGCQNLKLYLQPEWNKREQLMPLMVDYVKSNPKWIISLQTHKYLNIP